MPKTHLYNWLIMAFSEPVNSLMETFYYDKRDKEFYSIHVADYMLLNEDLSLNENVESSYTDSIAALIADRIRRADSEDEQIITVPRLEVEARKAIMEEFIRDVDDEKLLAILQQRIKNQDGSQRFDFYFGDEATPEEVIRWEILKRERLIPIIRKFMDKHNIDPDAAQAWDIGDSFSVSLDL